MSLYDVVKNSSEPYGAMRSELTRLARKNKILTSATLELTPICNFSCPFCYVRQTPKQMDANGESVLRFSNFWKRVIDELAEMNVDGLALTGGECMLHPDFKEIYTYAFKKGFSMGFITNGSCLTPDILEMLKEYPPRKITITMYGGCPETYEKVCGNKSFYKTVTDNIKLLKENGFLVVLQTTYCKDNIEDAIEINRFAKELDLYYQAIMDYNIARTCDPDAVEKYSPDIVRFNEVMSEAYKMFGSQISVSDEECEISKRSILSYSNQPVKMKGMNCGGSTSSCTINYKGQMLPCPTFDYIKIETDEKKSPIVGKNFPKPVLRFHSLLNVKIAFFVVFAVTVFHTITTIRMNSVFLHLDYATKNCIRKKQKELRKNLTERAKYPVN